MSRGLPFGNPETLADGEAVNVDVRGFRVLTVIAEDGATATVSRVDSMSAVAHTAITNTVDGSAAEAVDVFDCDWPYFRISVADADARWALAGYPE